MHCMSCTTLVICMVALGSGILRAGPTPAFEALGPVPSLPVPRQGSSPSLSGSTSNADEAFVLEPVNLTSRETSRLLYRSVYATSEMSPPAWNGDLESCNPGATDPAFRDLVALRINYFRAMVGVPAEITFDDGYSSKAQAAALMIARNLKLDHYPTTDWACYTEAGAEAAGNSNLALGRVGPRAIDAYIEDYGAANTAVGHRRWLLYPQTQRMGSGDIPGDTTRTPANVTWVFDGQHSAPRPGTREEFVAWPPPGYVPGQLVFPRWSLSLAKADFSNASVTLTSNGVPVTIELEPVSNGAGENSIVWYMAGEDTTLPSSPPRPETDTVYEVTIQNVTLNGASRTFNYEVVAFDPDRPGPDTVVPELTGPAQTGVSVPYQYTFNRVPAASRHQRLYGRPEALTAVEGAESGLANVVAATSPGYDPVVTNVKASGSRSFHLAHPAPNTDQTLTLQRLLIPSATASLRFLEYLGAATPAQTGRVEISLDDGLSWAALYTHAGSNGGGLIIFQPTTVPLGDFAGRLVRIRFNYHHDGGSFYNQTELGVGWYLDDVAFVGTQEVKSVAVTDLAGDSSFAFTAPSAGNHVLAVRGEFLGRYPLEWGPARSVTAVALNSPPIRLVGRPTLAGGQVQLDFQVTPGPGVASFVLLSAPSPVGPWQIEPDASFSVVQAGAVLRVSTSQLGRAQAFFQVRSE